jgi:hypothetical protein
MPVLPPRVVISMARFGAAVVPKTSVRSHIGDEIDVCSQALKCMQIDKVVCHRTKDNVSVSIATSQFPHTHEIFRTKNFSSDGLENGGQGSLRTLGIPFMNWQAQTGWMEVPKTPPSSLCKNISTTSESASE